MPILLLHLSYLGAGLTLVRCLPGHETCPRHVRLLFGYFAGVLFHVAAIHVAIACRAATPAICWVLVAVGLAGLAWNLRFGLEGDAVEVPVEDGRRMWVLQAAAGLALLPVAYLITLKLVGRPDISYDPTAFWNLKAKYLFYGEHLWSNAFTDMRRMHVHQSYPLYMPAFTFEHYAVLGAADDFRSNLGMWVYQLMGMLLFLLLVRQWAGTLLAIMATGIMLYAPLFSYRRFEGGIGTTYVDFPLSLMILGSVGFLLRYLVSRREIDMAAAAVFVTSALLQKREGTAWFIIFAVCAVPAIYARVRTHRTRAYIWFILPCTAIAGWRLMSMHLPGSGDVTWPRTLDLQALHAAVGKMAGAWMSTILDVKTWGLLLIYIAVLFTTGLLRSVKRTALILPAAMIIGYLAFIFAMFVLFDVTGDLFQYYMDVTHNRLILHVVPAGVLLATAMNTKEYRDAC